MEDIYESGEMYLETILLLQKSKGTVRSVDIVNDLGYAKSSVSRGINILKSKGFIVVAEDGAITFTETGLSRAQEIYDTSNSGTISKGGVSVSYDESGNNYFMYISYTDVTPELARAKVMAISMAEKEIVETKDENGKSVYVRMSTNITFVDNIADMVDSGNIPCSVNSGSKMTVVLAFIIGVIAAVLVVLLRYLLDDTLKTKEELERATGTQVFAFLSDVNTERENGKNG